ncbi:PQ-loop-domain-containing protein [Xylona heveae TC161]|uniref:PQ-loop-domain-containing protein n=1 Tax=Xylona heveae (strain CBS 132557 / TC161) TaxID=1328760 RepID=A0A165J3J9_XYLHT|nr:PQ-loop-domain-containing protein [Xylona heveae TC161]KZF25682.1 PQ-loop-domain-containing protein [Xylona heveae TC161]
MFPLVAAGIKGSLPWNEALSGVAGSVSLASWIFLLVPQLVENYKQGNAEGISLVFLALWFVGDITNFIGAIWADLVPTVIALAVYFCIADLVLIVQCIYYNLLSARRSKRQISNASARSEPDDPERPLLDRTRHSSDNTRLLGSRRRSSASHRHRGSHSSYRRRDSLSKIAEDESPAKVWIKNTVTVTLIWAAGVAGWAIAWKTGVWTPADNNGEETKMPAGAEILGYVSALCYLGARIPQIIKNYREKSCEGLSLLFFVLSLQGNITYGAGILFHSVEKEYFIKNIPWLIGSLGTMFEDIIIFMQFHIYADNQETSSAIEER